jgi:hypothetical protein
MSVSARRVAGLVLVGVLLAALAAMSGAAAVDGPDGSEYTDTLDGREGTGDVTSTVLDSGALQTNTAPTFEDSNPSLTVDEDANATSIDSLLTASDADNDTLTWAVSAAPSHGDLSGFDATVSGNTSSGVDPSGLTYEPNADFDGSDAFDVEVSDGNGGTELVTVNVTVQDAPEVSSITRADATPTNASSVAYDVTFTESVSGVDTSDFTLTTVSGDAPGTVASVGSSTGTTISVTVDSITGDGDLRLDLSDDDSITNGNDVPLGGVGTSGSANGSYTSGEAYTIDNTDPGFETSNTASIDEGATGDILDVNASDDGTTGSEVSTYSLASGAGSDAADFSIDSTTGLITLDVPKQFENPTDDDGNNDYELTVTATDDVGNSAVQNVTVTVTDVNELGNCGVVSYAGSGTDSDPFQVETVTQLQCLDANHSDASSRSDALSASYELTTDIDASATSSWNGGKGFDPIGTASDPFTGTFDGNNHTITGLTINRSSDIDVGMFGYTEGSEITDVALEAVDVYGNDHVGGLVGYNRDGTVEQSVASGAVSGVNSAGGLVGVNDGSGTVKLSYATGNVSGDGDVGGLVGDNQNTVTNSYATGDVSGNTSVGGLVGYNQDTVTNSYATGNVSGDTSVGGLVGDNDATVTDGYWDDAAATVIESGTAQDGQGVGANGGTADVEGLTTAELTGGAADHHMDGFDFTNTWATVDDKNVSYPYLQDNTQQPAPGLREAFFAGGASTAVDPWQVADWTHLDNVRENLGANFTLVNDLNESTAGYGEVASETANGGKGFDPIGNDSSPFTGTFDGDYYGGNYAITGLTIDRGGDSNVGLFGVNDGTVTGTNVTGSVTGDATVGALVGINNGTVLGSAATATVDGLDTVGGLVGQNDGTIEESSADGIVTGSLYLGGLVGQNTGTGSVTHSDAETDLASATASVVGGLVGVNDGTVDSSYAAGSVSGDARVGGVVGDNNGDVTGSYWDTESTGQTAGVGDAGTSNDVTGLTTAEMTGPDAGANMALDYSRYVLVAGYPGHRWAVADAPGYAPQCGEVSYNGSGTDADPYQIENVSQLQCMNTDLSADYVLTTDVEAGWTASWNLGETFDSVGTPSNSFTGTFDGRGNSISGLTIDHPNKDTVGLFGFTEGASITNVTLESVDVTGDTEVGGVFGIARGPVHNVHVSGTVDGGTHVGGLGGEAQSTVSNSSAAVAVSGDFNVGALVGRSWSGTIRSSYATGNVTGTDYVGGLVGVNEGGTIDSSYATGAVDGNTEVGGLVGQNYKYSDKGTIDSSYATGAVDGDTDVGGLVGYNYDATIDSSYATGDVSGDDEVGGLVGHTYQGTVRESYAIGAVDGDTEVGGFVGLNDNGDVYDSYWDTETTGQTTGINVTGSTNDATGLTTAEMKGDAAASNMTAFDFTANWSVVDNVTHISYPYLVSNTQTPAPGLESVSTSGPYFDVRIADVNGSVTAGEDVVVDATVENLGTASGTQMVDLTVNGTTEANRSVTLDTGGSTTETFTYTTDSGDTPAVEVGVASENETATTEEVGVSEPSGDVSLNKSIYSEERGDVATIGVEFSNTDTATVTIGTVGANNWAQNVTVEDGDGDDFVALEFNTYTAGTSDNGYRVYSTADDADSVVNVAPDSGAFDASDVVSTPSEKTLGADDYAVLAVAGTTPPSETADGEDAAGTLQLSERSTDSVTTYVAPEDRASDIADASDISTLQSDDNITESSVVVDGDVLLTRIDASGLEGVLTNRTAGDSPNATAAFFEETDSDSAAWEFFINQTNPGANVDAYSATLNRSTTDLIVDANDDTYWLVIDTDRVAEFSAGNELVTNFTTSDADGVNDDTMTVRDEWSFEEPTATVDTNADIDNDGVVDEVRVQQAAGQTISGTANVAPGTELTIRVNGIDEGAPFVKPLTTYVQPDGTWSTTADFSGNKQGANFTINVKQGNEQIIDQLVDGRIVAAPTASVTFTNQLSFGSAVTVDEVTLSDGGFVAMHRDNASGTVIGNSDYLETGSHSDVEITLDSTLDEDTTLVAMPHQDTDGDEQFEFESGSSVDEPYTENGTAVTDSAAITVTSDPYFDVRIDDVNESVTAGDDVVVNATVENTGSASGMQTVEFTVNGKTEASREVSLNDGGSTTETFSYTTESGDTPAIEVGVASENDTATETVTVAPSDPISYSGLSVSDTSVVTGESFDVSATVTNNDNTGSHSYTVELKQNGTVVDTRSGTLDAGNSTEVTFTTSFESSGTQTVTIANLTAETVTVSYQTNVTCIANCSANASNVAVQAIQTTDGGRSVLDVTVHEDGNVSQTNLSVASIGADNSTVYRVNVTVDATAFDPTVGYGNADFRGPWVENTSQTDTREISVETTPVDVERDVDGAGDSPSSSHWDGTQTAEKTVTSIDFAFAELGGANADKIDGAYITTDAQAYGVPSVDQTTNPRVTLAIAAPHYKHDGVTINTGALQAHLPDSLVDGVWGGASAEQYIATFSSQVTSSPTRTNVTGAGTELAWEGFTYSSGAAELGLDNSVDTADAGSDITTTPNTTVTFDATGSSDESGIQSYEWDVDDDNSYEKTGAQPSHSYGSTGTKTATVRVTDNNGNTDTDTVTVTVTDATAPSISSFSATNPAGQDVRVRFDSDEQLSTISVSISGPESGTLTGGDFSEADNGDGTYTYEATYSGSSDGDYTATLETAADDAGNDGASGQSATASVVTNDSPTASDDSYETTNSETLTVAAPGVLANDDDPDGDSLSATLETGVSHGALSLDADGSFEYTPDDGFVGEDSFTYRVTDGNGGADTASVTVSVTESPPQTPDFQVQSIDANGSVTAGEDVVVEYTVENTGNATGTQDVTVTAEGTQVAVDAGVTLDAGGSTTGTFRYTTSASDTPAIDIAVASENDTDTATVTVTETPPFFEVDIVGTNGPVTEGNVFLIDAQVENTGQQTGTQTVTLDVPGVGQDSTDVTLAGGQSTAVTLAVSTEAGDASETTATVTSENDTASAAVTVAEPAGFTVEITETNSPVLTGETLTVEADVENTGGAAGTQPIRLAAGGAVRDTTQVTLAGGESTTVTLTWATAQADGGDHDVVVTSDVGQSQTTVWVATGESDLGPPPVVGNDQPKDLDDDDVYRDLNGDGTVSLADVQLLFEYRHDLMIQDHAEYFDVDGDGTITLADVRALYQASLEQS